MILDTSPDCKMAYKTYIENFEKVQRVIGDIENERDEINVRRMAHDELFNRMGNMILKTIKQIKKEEYDELRKSEQEKWQKKIDNFEIKQYELELNNQQFQENAIRKMIENIFRELSYMSSSIVVRANRLQKEGDLSKVAKKERAILKANSDGFEWFNNSI